MIHKINYIVIILVLLWVGCDQATKENMSSTLSGKALYVLSDISGDMRAAKGLRVELLKDDKVLYSTLVSTDDGSFQLNDVQLGVYDIVFTTTERFRPSKIANFVVVVGENSLKENVLMYRYAPADSLHITVKFKPNVSEAEVKKLIEESGLELIGQSSSLLNSNLTLYNLKLPSGKSQLIAMEFFLKRTVVLDVIAGVVTNTN